MKMKWMAGVAAAAMFAAGAAQAEPDGWYGAIDLGYHWPEAEASFGGGASSDYSLENSWTGFARLGYRFNPSWRFELEGGYRPSDVDEPLDTGEVKVWSVMGNVIYDFMPDSSFRPFVGVGAGFAKASADVLGFGVAVDDDDTDFAWQALAGFSWALGERTNLDFTYRYFDGGEYDFVNAGFAGDIQAEYIDHSVTLGLRWAFAAPMAPPPPPPRRPRLLRPRRRLPRLRLRCRKRVSSSSTSRSISTS